MMRLLLSSKCLKLIKVMTNPSHDDRIVGLKIAFFTTEKKLKDELEALKSIESGKRSSDFSDCGIGSCFLDCRERKITIRINKGNRVAKKSI